MSKAPLVSICLPVYNGEKFIAQAIGSVLKQTYSNFELIIKDDRSKDSSPDIIRRLAEEDARIRFTENESNLGLFQNYNECMSAAEGKYIKLFAQDDLFEPKILERMVAVLEAYDSVSLVSCARNWLDESNEPLVAVSGNELKMQCPFQSDRQFDGTWIATESFRELVNWLGEPCSMMFRREQAKPGFDARFLQLGDLEFWYRILEAGDYFFISEPLCHFRKHSASTTVKNRTSLTSLLDWMLLASKHRRLIKAVGETEDDFAQRFARRFVYAITGRYYGPGKDRAKAPDSKMDALTDYASIFSSFIQDPEVPRDITNEYRAFAISCLREASRMQNEYRLVKDIVKVQRKVIIGLEVNHEEKVMAMQEEIDELRAALSELGNSLSWRVTAPLRNAKRLIR